MFRKSIMLLIVLLAFISLEIKAQQTQIEFQAQGGFVIPHRPSMLYLVQGHSAGFNVTISKRTEGFKLWQEVYQKPLTGFEFNLINPGNASELGVSYSINRIIDLPLGKQPNSLFRMRLGGGLAYLTKHFDKYENQKNAAIGSALNVSILLSAYANKTFKTFGLSAGLRLQHFSNGSFAIPNLGINIPSVFTAITFIPKKNDARTLSEFNPNVIIGEPQAAVSKRLQLSLGAKAFDGPESPIYGAWSLAFLRLKRISPKFSWNLFADLGFNNSHPARLRLSGKGSFSFAELLQVGGGIGLFNHYGNTAIFIQQGIYLQSLFIRDESRFYHKFGVEQSINQRFSAQVFLKSHFAKADYFALGCVYKL